MVAVRQTVSHQSVITTVCVVLTCCFSLLPPADRTEVQVIQGDITDYDSVLEACRGADVVVHMASLVDVWHRVPPSLIHAVNVAGQSSDAPPSGH